MRIAGLRKRSWPTVELNPISSIVGDDAGVEGDRTLKVLLSAAALAGSLSLLLHDWAGSALAYL
jgi:hypothetical protein